MAKTDNLNDFLKDIADAIREVSGKTESINAQDFASKIRGLKEVELITFTIRFGMSQIVEFQAEKNMTFEQWIVSKYCTVNSVVNGDIITFFYNGGNYCLESARTTTIIIDGYGYYASVERPDN